MIVVYADESFKDTHKYLVLGGVCACSENIQLVESSLQQIRDLYKTYGEVKWGKVSKGKYEFYKDYVNVFFDLCSQDIIHFHFLKVDTSTFNNRRYNEGNSELGFDKLLYQLLLHKFGARYGLEHKILVNLDERTTKNNPNDMTKILNAGMNKSYDVSNTPFESVSFENSKSTELLQINDLLIGAIGFVGNGYHELPGAAQHKKDFAGLVISRAGKLENINFLSKKAQKFTGWNFQYKAKGASNQLMTATHPR